LERYDRQLRIHGFGLEGQERLKRASVMVVGLGGLGCLASMYLAAAGVGRLVVIDGDFVELSNLNRQLLHWSGDVGKPKTSSAAVKLRQLNPEVEVVEVASRLDEGVARSLVEDVDVVVDGLDNYRSRLIINKACVESLKPYIYAGVRGFEGRVMTIVPGRGPCLRCLIPLDPPEPQDLPVLGATPGVAASLEAMEAVKLIVGLGEPLIGRLLVFNGLSMSFQTIKVERRPGCSVCGGLNLK